MAITTAPASATVTNLLDLAPNAARDEIARWVTGQNLPAYRTTQILRRLWIDPVVSWNQATELPIPLRAALAVAFPLPRLTLDTRQESADGTRKYLWRLHDGDAIGRGRNPAGGAQPV